MTAAERRALREAIDAARRSTLADEPPVCGYFHEPFPANPARPTKRFCCARHRSYAWYRDTEAGRAAEVRKNRRLRRRKGLPRRPGAEVAL